MTPSTTATQRISALSSHLSTSPNPTESAQRAMATEKKPPITCHVLDTSIGKPASSIPVTLTLLASTPLSFTSQTNADGRVASWTSSTPFSSASLEEVFRQQGDQRWSLRFDTENYFGERGVQTFFPEVEVKFLIRESQKGEHFHVPVLVGGFGYSTYRGS